MTAQTNPISRSVGEPAPVLGEQRVSSLVGDRLCVGCNYNLVGQPVLREPHYQMLIVRCPECATVASVQEYPLLGRWAGRWASLLAAVWMLLIVGLWVGTAAVMFGFSIGVAEWASEAYSRVLRDEHLAWQSAALSQIQAVTVPVPVAGANPTPAIAPSTDVSFKTWWESLDHSQFIKKHGGWSEMIEWTALLLWVPLGALSFMFGCAWAVILLAQRVRGRLLWGVCVLAVALMFAAIPIIDWFDREPDAGWTVARQTVGPIMLGTTLAVGFIMLSFGLIVGRPFTRGLLCVLLTPRLRSSLAGLWLADGLEPPSPAQR